MQDVDIGIDDDSGDEQETQSKSRHAVRRTEHHHHRLPPQQPAEEKEDYSKERRTVTRDTEEESSAVFSSYSSPSPLSSYDPSVLSLVSSMQTQLQQKDQDLQQLSEALLTLKASPSSSLSSASTPSAAIVKDMMRKQRELHLQLSRERQQHAQETAALRQQLNSASASVSSAAGAPSPSSPSSSVISSLQQEVTTLTSRLSSARLQSSQLKQRMARMQAVLEREVGDVEAVAALLVAGEVKEGDDDGEREEKRRDRQPASAASAAADSSAWKGRAERVRELERKVAALERKLKDQQHRPAASPLSASSPDKKEEVESLRRQLEQSAKAVSELTAARKVQRSRVSALEAEMAEMKDRLLTVLGKSDKDDTLLDQLSLSLRQEKAERDRQTTEADCRQREQQLRIAQLTSQLEQAEAQLGQYRLIAETVDAVTASETASEERQHRQRTEALESCISALQQRCDELDRDRTQSRSAKAEVKEGAEGREGRKAERGGGDRQQPQQQAAGAGEKTSDVKRRLLEMVGERELIRESYAAMLARRDEEMERWKQIRQQERQEESRTRQQIKGRIDQLQQQLQHSSGK